MKGKRITGVKRAVKVVKAPESPKIIFCQSETNVTEGFLEEKFPLYIPQVNDIVRSQSDREFKVIKIVHANRDNRHTILAYLHAF